MTSSCFTELLEQESIYLCDDEYYTIHFPKEWAVSHKMGSGPKECSNCADFGSWNGVFIGYCMNCADYMYNYERGSGFYTYGIETSVGDPCLYAMNTYLKNVDFRSVGVPGYNEKCVVDEDGNPYLSPLEKKALELYNKTENMKFNHQEEDEEVQEDQEVREEEEVEEGQPGCEINDVDLRSGPPPFEEWFQMVVQSYGRMPDILYDSGDEEDV
jgi:hypothetical protein